MQPPSSRPVGGEEPVHPADAWPHLHTLRAWESLPLMAGRLRDRIQAPAHAQAVLWQLLREEPTADEHSPEARP